jgi:hypothetical protein
LKYSDLEKNLKMVTILKIQKKSDSEEKNRSESCTNFKNSINFQFFLKKKIRCENCSDFRNSKGSDFDKTSE